MHAGRQAVTTKVLRLGGVKLRPEFRQPFFQPVLVDRGAGSGVRLQGKRIQRPHCFLPPVLASGNALNELLHVPFIAAEHVAANNQPTTECVFRGARAHPHFAEFFQGIEYGNAVYARQYGGVYRVTDKLTKRIHRSAGNKLTHQICRVTQRTNQNRNGGFNPRHPRND